MSPKSTLSYIVLLLCLSVQTDAHRNGARNRAHAHVARGMEERLLPITATTTVVVQMTKTETVWVAPTGQVVLAPPPETSSDATSITAGTDSAVSSSSSWTPSSTAQSSSHVHSSSAASSQGLSSSMDSASMTSSITLPSGSPSPSSSSVASSHSDIPSSSSSAVPSGPGPASISLNTESSSASSAMPSSTASLSTSSAGASITGSLMASSSSVSSSMASESMVSSSMVSFSAGSSTASSTEASSSMASSSIPSSSSIASSSSYIALSSSSIAASSSAIATSSSSIAPSSSSSAAASSSVTSVASSTISSTVVSSTMTSTSTSASASSTSTAGLETLGSTLMNAYYPDWSGWYLTPEQVDWSKYDVIDFAFALPTADFNLEFTQWNSADLLNRLVKTGHAAGKRVKLSIGGWTGSTYFSSICASASNRQTFISNIMSAYNLYNLDGIDIDWEYPGTYGAASNGVSSSDSANFLLFLTELRAAMPVGGLISTATQVWPFAGSDGNPMSDVSGFANVIDWILIMNYDVWGSSSTPGANAPLSDGCHNSSQPLANAYAAVSSWTTAGMPANKITLGVPAYGYLQKSSATGLKDRRGLPAAHKRLRPNNHGRGNDVTVYNGNGGTTDGQVMFEGLISQGALTLDASSGLYVGANGFTREWDSCSSTPWLKSVSSGQIVTYDDPTSMSLKGQFALQAGIRGCNVFSIDGDWTGSGFPLTDAVRSGMGI